MLPIVFTLVDLHHILHPKQLNEKHDRDQPTFFRRIAGIVLLALSIPFTLGIATGFYAYWAYRKVVHIKEQDRKDLDHRVVKIFGETHGEKAGSEEKPERATFEAALKALQRGDKKVMMTKVGEFGEETLTKDMKKALIATAVDYDRIDALNELWTSFRSVYIPLYRAKSPEMVDMIVGKAKKKNVCINRDHGDGNTALHHQQNLEVVKALTEQGAEYKRNNEGKMPLHLCTDPKIAQHLIDHFGKGILEEKDNEGRTAFLTAPAAVKHVLIEKGANVKAEDNRGGTVLCYFSGKLFKEEPELINTIIRKFDDNCSIDFSKYFIDYQTLLDLRDEFYAPFRKVKGLNGEGIDKYLTLPCKKSMYFPHYSVRYTYAKEGLEEVIDQMILNKECEKLTGSIYSYKIRNSSKELLFNLIKRRPVASKNLKYEKFQI